MAGQGVDPLVRFGVFTDVHYAGHQYMDRYCYDSLEKLKICIEMFNERGLSMVVNLGDSIDKAERKEEELAFLAAVRGVYEGFRGEWHEVLGNHDVATLTKEEFLTHCSKTPRAPYYSFDYGPVHFVVLDANCHVNGSDFSEGDFEWDEAWIPRTQLEWLDKDLAATGDRPVVILVHENLDHRLYNGALDPHVVRNADQVRFVLERAGNVQLVLQGHYHPGMKTVINGIPYIGLRAMVVGAGMGQNAFGICRLYGDGRVGLEGFGEQDSAEISSKEDGDEAV